MSNPSKEVMRRSVERHLTDLERMGEFDRGYRAGRQAMDAERQAIALKLRGLDLTGSSHENLSKMAYAIYPCATGWTAESCKGLRDQLVRLLGGVNERETTLTTCDVLDNERHKAVCELRYVRNCLKGDPTCKSLDIADAIGAKLNVGDKIHESICDRLIYLLGGDQPSGIDALSEMDEESDGDETCPNDVPTPSITDELRVWAHGLSDPWKLNVEAPLLAIADRIEEQFNRICWQREAVLQSTIDEMVTELDSARAKNRRLTRHIDQMQGGSRKWREECEALKAANADLAKGIDDARESEYRAERQRDELQAKLDEIAGVLDGRD